MWEAGRNWLRQFLIEVPHPAIFILLLVPLASGMGVCSPGRTVRLIAIAREARMMANRVRVLTAE